MSSSPPLAAAVDSDVAAAPIPEDRPVQRWSATTRIGFRFAFCYLGGYCLFNGNATVWDAIPVIGRPIQDGLARVFLLPAQFLAQHLFHVAPPGNHLHPTGSGDTAIDWIALLLLLIASILATAIWSLLDRRRPNYRTLQSWLRLVVRFTVATGMVIYGMDKLFPLQMGAPVNSDLSEPLGMHSPMSLLWLFIGLNPLYERVCGAVELLGGLLLLFRRTALTGALFSAFVVTNVLLYNLFFDVPVKLYAGHLLLLSLFLILPDAAPLFRFFWLHQPAAPAALWAPPTQRRWARRTLVGVEIAFAALILGGSLFGTLGYWRHYRQLVSAPCAICGAWRLDPAQANLPSPFSPDTAELAINSPGWAILRSADGKPTGLGLKLDDARHTLEFDATKKNIYLFAYTQSDPTHLVLTPANRGADGAPAISLTGITPPGGYPLVRRGFHWVSEYPYTR